MTNYSTRLAVLLLAALTLAAAARAHAGDDAAADATTPVPAASATAPAADAPPAIDEMPVPIKTVPPTYPASAVARKQEGTVHVQARVGKSGKVDKVRLVPGRGVAPDLDRAALDAVKQWEFKPARVKGQPKAAWVVIPIAFRLH